ncbi:hypothetical protein FH609_006975 [Streptomyces sp. 3MP-14]|uniref:WXG100 family type VII secretion target n=1 Tax=Streptomyces mimosae TaxID=2586635 RepID=A0A5N6AJK0_9ACTN|nr:MULTISPECIES: hypothetical protein [Streptomyces]KAB8168844.1 hypothetical protein FH607_006390 [Streptomyces mimosae]KAB8177876.1 hypothetical protein FH609_006975 [Streptomyces sp. 3MP-14]
MNISIPVAPSPAQQAEYPSLGFVPCPGDPGTAGHVAFQVRQTATALEDVVALLRGTRGGEWRGRSAEAWRERWEDDFTPKVEDAHESFRIAARALEEWAQHMPSAQEEALRLEGLAHEAEARLSGLPEPANLQEILFDTQAGSERQEAMERAERERNDLDRATADLEAIRREAEALAEDYREHGARIAGRLWHAMNIAPNEPGWLSSFGDWLGGLAEELARATVGNLQEIASWISRNAERIAAVGDALAVMSTLTGLISSGLLLAAGLTVWAPPVAAALAGASGVAQAVSAGFAAGALVAHGTARLAGADVSGRTFTQDVLGALPLVGRVRQGGRIVDVLADNDVSQWGTVDSVTSIFENPEALTYFIPRDGRQGAEMFAPGGPLLVAFENAWRAGGEG